MSQQRNSSVSGVDRRRLLQGSGLMVARALIPAGARAALPLPDPMKPVPIPQQVPVEEGYADLAGTRLWYWDTGGTGTPVVFMHPASSSATIWPYQQPVFAKAGYRVIAYSRRGYGQSDPVTQSNPGIASVDLHQLAEYLSLSRFHLVASAGGCSFSNDYALSHPEKVCSLVLSSGLGGEQDAEYLAVTKALTPTGYSELPTEFRELGPSYRAANPGGVKQWVALTENAVTGNRFGQTFANKITWDLLSRMKVPVLLMTGDADLNAPPAIMRMFAARIPNNEIAFIPEAGHSSHWEQPEAFNRVVLDFIGRH